MTNNEVEQIFIDILETTPGVKKILRDDNLITPFNVQEAENSTWNFSATINILTNTSAKDLVRNISSLLKYALKEKDQKVGKIHLFIGGLSND
ncbi:hypothetical protein [Mycoplasmopsis primatum]|uniref:hypothetical protein n=1 Tax=Mycoplasmopsis primatum TaxID=55604 RepID=UPI0004963C44|nr:hypothetical protein [Mycoplasmopsis primatum]